jgi:hypothetical protein
MGNLLPNSEGSLEPACGAGRSFFFARLPADAMAKGAIVARRLGDMHHSTAEYKPNGHVLPGM